MEVLDRPIAPSKANIARRAVAKHNIRSFADLGGCWGVHAGYTLDLLRNYPIDRAYVLDQHLTDLSRERGAEFQQLEFISGMLGDVNLIEKIPQLDALIMFDILLHQVKPDWDEFLRLWAQKARVLIIFNQMWAKDDRTIRFIDRGREWFKENVYYTNEGNLDKWWDQHGQLDPATGRKVEDMHNIWQFGITHDDLVSHIRSLGFRMDYFEHFGKFAAAKQPWIQNEGFIFVRD